MANYYVWLDAGHSVKTPGKRNTVTNPKFYEYEFNNDIAVKLKARLEAHGITVYLTNTTPNGVDISLTTRANTANSKWNSLGKPSNAIFVSIHGNASTGAWASARGVEVYHANNASSKSKKLASLLTNQIYTDIKAIDSGFKQRGVKSANFTVIFKANMPSVLIEHGFYDNKADLDLMQNKRNVFVEADCKAICEYFGITYKKNTNTTTTKPKQEANTNTNVFYRVICGSYSVKANAEEQVEKLKAKGFNSFLNAKTIDGKVYYRVICGSYSVKANAQEQIDKLKAKGFSAFVEAYNK